MLTFRLSSALLGLAGWIYCVPANAQATSPPHPKASSPVSFQGTALTLGWLSPGAQVRARALASLEALAGRSAVDLTELPSDELDFVAWRRDRWSQHSREPRVFAAAVLDELALCSRWLDDASPARRRLALILARQLAKRVGARLPSPQGWILAADILDGWVLSHINTIPDREMLSTSQKMLGLESFDKPLVLRDACTIYRLNGQNEALFAALGFLIPFAERAGDTENADWGRVKLAEAYSARGNYSEAIALLQAVKSPNLNGALRWIPDLETKLKEATRKMPPTSTQNSPSTP